MKNNTIAEAHGWQYFDSCRCGLFRVEYRHPKLTGLALFIYPAQKLFLVRYKGSTTKIPVTTLAQLEATLTKLENEEEHTETA